MRWFFWFFLNDGNCLKCSDERCTRCYYKEGKELCVYCNDHRYLPNEDKCIKCSDKNCIYYLILKIENENEKEVCLYCDKGYMKKGEKCEKCLWKIV